MKLVARRGILFSKQQQPTTMQTITTKGGTKLAYRLQQGRGVPFVFIHGAYLESGAWQPQLQALKGFTYALVDLRGHGQSEKTSGIYSVEQFAEDVADLLEQLGWEQVIVVGHSLGGMVAQVLAVEVPRLVHRLMLIDTSFGVRSNKWEAFLTNITMPFFSMIPVKWQARLFADQIGKHSTTGKAYVLKTITAHAADKTNYSAIWQAVVHYDGYAQLKLIDCPTLILVGAKNPQTHQQARIMQQQIPDAQLMVIENAGHLVPWDNATAVNEILLGLHHGG